MKDYYNKKEKARSAPPEPVSQSRHAISEATINAMLDKMSALIRQRDAWANLAKLVLLRGSYDTADEEIRVAFAAVVAASPGLQPSTLSPE